MEYKLEGDFVDASEFTMEQLVWHKSKRTILQATALLFDLKRQMQFEFGEFHATMSFENAVYNIDGSPTKDIAIISKVGQKICFVIENINFSSKIPIITLSRAEAQKRCYDEYLSRLRIGDIIKCRVTHIEKYGAFCDIGCGVSGLLHIDCLSVSRIQSPNDRVCRGDTLRCVVKSFDEKGRILLSVKELLGTWDENAACFFAGETVMGIVRSIEEYGVFIELAPNLSGLAEPVDGLMPGQNVSVYIKSIIPEKMKIKLAVVGIIENIAITPKLKYFFDGGHIDVFSYASLQSSKDMTTVF